ncbi:WXG100 family type VII secretion target [Streptomyces sp. NPDC047046]|uniref:WXG100 family type VII secretion target n=1 Tax=Streptomyces sp. NPDC047046 TaxID=3155378 RepID=UPI0033BFF395
MAKDAELTYAEMRRAAGRLTEARTTIDEDLETLERYIEQLVRDGYTTRRSSVAFEESFKEFKRGIKNTIQGLDGMSSFLHQAAQSYEDLDAELARGVGR